MLAFRDGNPDAVANLFVENGELNIVDRSPIKGKSNIASFLRDKRFPDDITTVKGWFGLKRIILMEIKSG